MPRWIFRWLVNALALLAAAALLNGVRIDTASAVIIAAALLGIVHISVRPVLLLVTLPINLLTLGLFTFVINALMLMLVAGLVPGFSIDGFWWSVLTALVLSVVNAIITRLTPYRWSVRYYY